jgi:hypothetical protein
MPENKINTNFNREKHMKNGQKTGDFDVKRDNTGRNFFWGGIVHIWRFPKPDTRYIPTTG